MRGQANAVHTCDASALSAISENDKPLFAMNRWVIVPPGATQFTFTLNCRMCIARQREYSCTAAAQRDNSRQHKQVTKTFSRKPHCVTA